MAPSSESEEHQLQDGLRHTMVGRGQICFTRNSHTESLSLGDNMPNRHQEQFKQAGAMRTGLVVGDGYAAADTRANASRVYNVFRLEDICHQCIHTEIQKSTCIMFCISCYMYHMYHHMYESVAVLAQSFILPIASQTRARTEWYRS